MLTPKDSTKWSFSKSERFPKMKNLPTDVMLSLPSTLRKRGVRFSHQNRWSMSPKPSSPSPGTYNISSIFQEEKAQRKTIGNPLSKLPSIQNLSPGPGAYNVIKQIGNTSPRYSFRAKNSKAIQQDQGPTPQSYSPSRRITEKTHYSGIGIGYGERLFLRRLHEGPGPGAYSVTK